MTKTIATTFVLAALGAIGLSAQVGEQAESLVDLFARVRPAVVVLYTEGRQASRDAPGQEVSAAGLGSGVLVDREGHIVTAAHVVQTADAVVAVFFDGTQAPVEIVASDPIADVALLRVAAVPVGIEPVPLGDSDAASVGEEVFVVGAPYGLGHTLTVGHISGRRENVDETLDLGVEFFQTDASINQGNSGGPMFNMRGEVLGIVSYILTQSGGFEGLGFAVTSNVVRDVLFDRRMFWSGMTGLMLEDGVAAAFNIPQQAGYLVQRVAHGSPAEDMGLQPGVLPVTVGDRTILLGGDVILAVEGIEMSRAGFAAIRRRLSELREGEPFRVQVLRGGRRTELMGVR